LIEPDDDPDGVTQANFYDYGPGSTIANLLVLLETREGRRRFAKRVDGLPEWTVERSETTS
jgi:hypothetical protein